MRKQAVTEGFYIVGPNSSPIEGPFETVSEAMNRIPKTRGSAVEWLVGETDPEWDALRAEPFPFGLNTVNGSRRTAIRTADNKEVGPGDRVFDYYDGHWGTVGEPDDEGWFDHQREDGEGRGYLNGDRVTTVIPPGNPFYKSHGDGNPKTGSLKTAGSHDPIGYTYDADVHCPGCAIARFGKEPGHPWVTNDAEDSEGNPVHPIAPWDETSEEGEHCATCGGEIAPAWTASLHIAAEGSELPEVWRRHAQDRAAYSGTDDEWGVANRANPNSWVTEWQLIAPEMVRPGEYLVHQNGSVRTAALDDTCPTCGGTGFISTESGPPPVGETVRFPVLETCPSCHGVSFSRPNSDSALVGSNLASRRTAEKDDDQDDDESQFDKDQADRDAGRPTDSEMGADFEKDGSWQDRYATARRVGSLRHFQ